jgi:hypothetical protein
MKTVLAIVFFAASVASTMAQDPAVKSATAACGPPATQFNVKTQAGTVQPQPDAGKALVYVIEEQKFAFVRSVTARVGVDGAWAGATRGNTYVSFQVEPGEHHLCTDWTSSFLHGGRLISLNSFNAEPGKIYYFRARTSGAKYEAASIDLDEVNSDEGKLMVAMSSASDSHAKK